MKVNDNHYLLAIQLEFSIQDRVAEEILRQYIKTAMADDLNQLTWNMVNCDSNRQILEFGIPKIAQSDISRNSKGITKLQADVTFSGNNYSLIEQAAGEYLLAFDDYIRSTILEYRSRSGMKITFDGRPESYSYQISKV